MLASLDGGVEPTPRIRTPVGAPMRNYRLDGALILATDFSRPDPDGSGISRRLTRRLRTEIRARGWIGFERFMERALYEPELGYYNNASTKFGPLGDFVTAPELSPVLAGALAARFADHLRPFDDPVVLEVGAGTGQLAVDLARALRARDIRARYWILEPSPELRNRQRQRCAAAGIETRWLDEFPHEPFDGAIIANEVLDAFPTTCFVKRAGEVRPLGVGWAEKDFTWMEGPADAELSGYIASLEKRLGRRLADGYRSEVSRQLPSWMRRVATALHCGAVYVLDYGLTETDYYHPQRAHGTLICHYRHRAHDNPFHLPGLQDISAWVDFSACARAARQAGLTVEGFTTQGHFLVESGMKPEARTQPGAQTQTGTADPAAAQALKTLVLPGEMGERFKLLVLSRGMTLDPPPGRDFRARL
ncbi:MAG: SAM-dependent methyltransferase [Rhodospirillaceae bacterium]|nr:SAM-dependent methyltransferase [Rhodospirillaceae bacterium]